MLNRVNLVYKTKQQKFLYKWRVYALSHAANQQIKNHAEFIDRLAHENLKLKSEPNMSFADKHKEDFMNCSPKFKGECRSQNSAHKRYHLRAQSPYSTDRDFRFLYPETENARYSESPSPRSKKDSPRNGYADSYSRLKNKQYIDKLYEKGKQKLLSRSRSVYMPINEAEELKECSFHPRVKHNLRLK